MANETLLHRGSRAFTAPPADAPRAADLSAGLYAHWHYDDLPAISTGTEYSSWTSRVNGFTLTPISGLRAPTRQASALNGRGAVAFDYPDATSTPAMGMQIATGGGFTLDATATGVTFATVAYNRSYKGAGGNPTSRLFASTSTSNYYVFGSNSSYAGIGIMLPNGTGAMYTPPDDSMDGRWFVAVGVITPSETRLYVDNLPVLTGIGAGAATSTGFKLGVNAQNASPFTGFLREARVYRKALSDAEARALVAALQWEHQRIVK